jgi:hypothetical protein
MIHHAIVQHEWMEKDSHATPRHATNEDSPAHHSSDSQEPSIF